MDITWHGLSCFSIKGKTGTLVTDPYDTKAAGLKLPKFSADVALANSDFELHNAVSQLGGEVKIFDWPGEYEAKTIIVQGIPAFDRPRDKDDGERTARARDRSETGSSGSQLSKVELKNNISGGAGANRVIIFTIKIDGFNVCHLSNLGHKLTQEMIEAIGNVDILLIPIGGGVCLDSKKAHEVIEQLDPRIVIPMYYKTPGVKLALDELAPFLKEVGQTGLAPERTAKFTLPSALPQEKMEFKILEAVTG